MPANNARCFPQVVQNKATNQNARSLLVTLALTRSTILISPSVSFCGFQSFPRNAIGHRLGVGVRENLAKRALTKTIESSPWFKCMTWYHAAQSTTPCNTWNFGLFFSISCTLSGSAAVSNFSFWGYQGKKECYGVFAILLYHVLQIIDSWRANNLKNSHSANRSKHIKRRRDLPNRTQGCANNLLCHNTLQAFSWNLQFSTNEVVICLCTHSWT